MCSLQLLNNIFLILIVQSSYQKEVTVHKTQRKVFVDTIVGKTNLLEIDESEIGSECSSESGSDVSCSTFSTSSSSEEVENLEDLNMSYDNDFISHNYEDFKDSCDTVVEAVDMEITSELDVGTIETNIPAPSKEDMMVEANTDTTTLIPEDFVRQASSNVNSELVQVNERRFICSITKLNELFSFCMDIDFRMPVFVRERFVGSSLKINWRCKSGHEGDWHSSSQVKKVYVDNIMAASSLLFSGNNFTKFLLFAKCMQLAFFSSSTFYSYQKRYLVPEIHSWWNNIEERMFDNLKGQPVVVSGDGQMDLLFFQPRTAHTP